MTELSFSQKYADAFWRLVPIPALVVANVIALTLHPSRAGVLAVAVLAAVGLGVEGVLWRRLRLRWQPGLDPQSVGKLVESNHRREVVLASIVLLAAITWRASSVAENFSEVLITIFIGVSIFGGAIALDIVSRRR